MKIDLEKAMFKVAESDANKGFTHACKVFAELTDSVENYAAVCKEFPKYKAIRVAVNQTQKDLRVLFDAIREQTGVKVYDFRGAFRWSTADGKFVAITHGKDLMQKLEAEKETATIEHIKSCFAAIEAEFSTFIENVFMKSETYLNAEETK